MSKYSYAFLPRTRRWSNRTAALVGTTVLVAAGAVALALSPSSNAAAGFTGYQVITGAPVAITDGATVSATIDCPSGQSALSGGISSHNSMMFLDVLAPVSASEWSMTVTQTGTLGYTEHFTPYIICVDTASVPGLHYNTTSNTAAANTQTIKDAFCDLATEYVVGGGFNAGLSGPHASISYPVGDNRTWQVGVDNPTGSPTAFTVYAVCVPQADVSSYTQLSGSYTSFAAYMDQPVLGGPSAARTNNGASASGYCPAGTLASGGGVFDHDQDNDGFIVSSYPSDDHRYWLQTSTDLNPPSYGEWSSATVVCVSAVSGPPCSVSYSNTTVNSPLVFTTPGAVVCISNSTVNGAITVVHGALYLENSTVRGAVTSSAGTGLEICGSSTSTVTVSASTGFVRIGDPANNCATNVVNGSITASANHGGGSIIGNTVHGSVITPGNVPAFTVSGNHA
jgi:hypothetical protein